MSDEPVPFVSVVVPVYEDLDRLMLCLKALENQSYPRDRYEVVVVDNSSRKRVEPVVENFNCAVAVQEDRQGSYAARNTGISRTSSQIIAFTDADCIPERHWLEKGVEKLLEVPGCGLVAGKIAVFPKDSDRATAVELYECATAFTQQRFLEVGKFAATANIFTFRSVFEDVGLFDGKLHSGGDYEWSRRVYWAGYEQAYADRACVYHPARRSLGQLYRKIMRVAGGVHELKRRGEPHIGLQGEFLLLLLFPPVRAMIRILREDGFAKPYDKVRIILIIFVAKYLNLWSRLRLILRDLLRM